MPELSLPWRRCLITTAAIEIAARTAIAIRIGISGEESPLDEVGVAVDNPAEGESDATAVAPPSLPSACVSPEEPLAALPWPLPVPPEDSLSTVPSPEPPEPPPAPGVTDCSAELFGEELFVPVSADFGWSGVVGCGTVVGSGS